MYEPTATHSFFFFSVLSHSICHSNVYIIIFIRTSDFPHLSLSFAGHRFHDQSFLRLEQHFLVLLTQLATGCFHLQAKLRTLSFPFSLFFFFLFGVPHQGRVLSVFINSNRSVTLLSLFIPYHISRITEKKGVEKTIKQTNIFHLFFAWSRSRSESPASSMSRPNSRPPRATALLLAALAIVLMTCCCTSFHNGGVLQAEAKKKSDEEPKGTATPPVPPSAPADAQLETHGFEAEEIFQYSAFVQYPILLYQQEPKPANVTKDQLDALGNYRTYVRTNDVAPVWFRPIGDVQPEEYTHYYKTTTGDYHNPMYWSHFKVEGAVEFTSLLYIPGEDPDTGNWTNNFDVRPGNKKLDQPMYTKLWEEFGKHLRMGILEDQANRARIARLLRYKSSQSEGKYISLQTYIERMKEDQNAIYYLSSDSLEKAERSAIVSDATARGIEVLFFTDPIDDFLVMRAPEFAGRRLVNLGAGGEAEFHKNEKKSDREKVIEELREAKYAPLMSRLQKLFGEKDVGRVILTKRLHTKDAFIITSLDASMTARMMKIMKTQTMAQMSELENQQPVRVLELNYRHPLVQNLKERFEKDPNDRVARDIAWTLYDSASVESEFGVKDSAAYAKRLNRLLRTCFPPDDEEYDVEAVLEARAAEAAAAAAAAEAEKDEDIHQLNEEPNKVTAEDVYVYVYVYNNKKKEINNKPLRCYTRRESSFTDLTSPPPFLIYICTAYQLMLVVPSSPSPPFLLLFSRRLAVRPTTPNESFEFLFLSLFFVGVYLSLTLSHSSLLLAIKIFFSLSVSFYFRASLCLCSLSLFHVLDMPPPLTSTKGGMKKAKSIKSPSDLKQSSRAAPTSSSSASAVSSSTTPADTTLPRRLSRTTALVEPMLTHASATSPAHLAASKELGQVVSRQSLAALYELAYSLRRTTPLTSSSSSPKGKTPQHHLLNSAPLPFHAPRVETSAAKRTTSDQIWGQMTVLLRPVLRRLQDRVREAQKVFGDDAATTAKQLKKKTEKKQKKQKKSQQEEEEEEDAEAETPISELSEGELDEEIAHLLEAQKMKREAKRKTKGGGDGEDAWRYAFGKGNAVDENLDEEDEEGRDEAIPKEDDWGEDDEDGAGRKERDVSDRNRRAMAAAANDEDEDADEEGDADDELAALKEMYGEDFDADDAAGFLGDEEDDDVEEGEEKEGEEDDDDEANHPRHLYREQDGQFYGYDNILDEDPDGMFRDREALEGQAEGEMNFDAYEGRDDPTAVRLSAEDELDAELAKDEELQAFLRRDDVSALEKERLVEKKKVHLLEQRRLYGVNQWAMAGETSAVKRPREALLELDQLDFEYGMKSVPVITESVTQKLEERIKQRILERNYDDVVRRVQNLSSPDDLASMAKRAAAQRAQDAEKSKLSLMDLYEKEFMEKQRLAEEGQEGQTAEPLTAIERDELRAIQMWRRLSQHLDALSNFHFTPKPVKQDLEARVRAVEGQAPALVMESVGNFAATREAALAPQDMYRSIAKGQMGIESGMLVGSAELSPEERRALRRKRKEAGAVKQKIVEQRKHRLQEEQKKKKAAAGEGGSSQGIVKARGRAGITEYGNPLPISFPPPPPPPPPRERRPSHATLSSLEHNLSLSNFIINRIRITHHDGLRNSRERLTPSSLSLSLSLFCFSHCPLLGGDIFDGMFPFPFLFLCVYCWMLYAFSTRPAEKAQTNNQKFLAKFLLILIIISSPLRRMQPSAAAAVRLLPQAPHLLAPVASSGAHGPVRLRVRRLTDCQWAAALQQPRLARHHSPTPHYGTADARRADPSPSSRGTEQRAYRNVWESAGEDAPGEGSTQKQLDRRSSLVWSCQPRRPHTLAQVLESEAAVLRQQQEEEEELGLRVTNAKGEEQLRFENPNFQKKAAKEGRHSITVVDDDDNDDDKEEVGATTTTSTTSTRRKRGRSAGVDVGEMVATLVEQPPSMSRTASSAASGASTLLEQGTQPRRGSAGVPASKAEKKMMKKVGTEAKNQGAVPQQRPQVTGKAVAQAAAAAASGSQQEYKKEGPQREAKQQLSILKFLRRTEVEGRGIPSSSRSMPYPLDSILHAYSNTKYQYIYAGSLHSSERTKEHHVMWFLRTGGLPACIGWRPQFPSLPHCKTGPVEDDLRPLPSRLCDTKMACHTSERNTATDNNNNNNKKRGMRVCAHGKKKRNKRIALIIMRLGTITECLLMNGFVCFFVFLSL
eukprot:gene848-485_t